jgi:hypothetical protein
LTTRSARSPPGKEADVIILDATRINVAPLNQVPGAVVSLMDRTNIETVIVAGKVRKWKGQLLDVDLPRLRQQLEASPNYVFQRGGHSAGPVPQQLTGMVNLQDSRRLRPPRTPLAIWLMSGTQVRQSARVGTVSTT